MSVALSFMVLGKINIGLLPNVWKEDKEGLALGVSLSNQRVRGIGGVILRMIYVSGGRHLSTFQAASNSAIIMKSHCAVI